MTIEQINRANELVKEIKELVENINKAKYMTHDNVVIRESYIKCNGVDGSIEAPESLFRVIGGLIISENTNRLNELKSELESL